MALPLRYTLGNIAVRRSASALTALGIAMTVAVFAGVLSLNRGFKSIYAPRGAGDLAIYLRPGATSEGESVIRREEAAILTKERPEVRIETADGKAYPEAGRLNFASSTVDASLGTVQMRAELPNAKLRILPGQYVRVQVVAGRQPAILVPQDAVQQNESGRYVWVIGPEGKAAQRTIRAGNWVGRDWVVLDGLKPGENVIVDNLVRLRPGTPVQVKPRA